MAATASVLVAHRSEATRALLGARLFEAGFEVVSAVHGEEALRSTAGANPAVVIAQLALPRITAPEVHARLLATGLALPPFVILYDDPAEVPEGVGVAGVHYLPADAADPERLIRIVRMLVLSRDLFGEFAGGLEEMHGDLTRISFGELLQALQKHVFTGRLSFAVTPRGWVWFRDGEVVDAAWGAATARKALNRLAGLPTGAFNLAVEEPPRERNIDTDIATLLTEAVEERLGYDELASELPSMESTVEVRLVPRFFSLEFSSVERQIMGRAKELQTLGRLVDQVEASDLEVVRAVKRLKEEGIFHFHPPAARFQVVTDSTSDLQPAEARRLGVGLVAASVVLDGTVFKDGVDLTPEEFARRLKGARQLPVTAPVTRGEFVEVLRRGAASADVLAVLCSSGLSKSYEHAVAAVAEAGEDFERARREAGGSGEPVVLTLDSGQSSGPLGLLVTLAVRMARRGLTVQAAAERVADLAARMRTHLLVGSLEYLQHAGVIRPEKLKGRAILRIAGGVLQIVDRVDPVAAMARLVERAAEGFEPSAPVMAALVHASAPAEAAQLRSLLEERLRVVELQERQMGPAVTCHVGPGTVGVGLFATTEEELKLLRGNGG